MSYLPEDGKAIKKLPSDSRRPAIDSFIKGFRLRVELRLKKSDVREAMMHQTYMGTMALLLDPNYKVPSDFESKYIAKFCLQIEQSFRWLDLSSWSHLRLLTKSFEVASVTFMRLNGITDHLHEHNSQYREFVKSLMEVG